MITSRQGWVEVPYCTCPAGSAELAAGLKRHVTDAGRMLHFVPGLSIVGADGVPDVIRGEETQIIGELGRSSAATGAAPSCCPGPTAEWVVDGHRLVWFATFMTGEVFALLKAHSILGRLMAGEATDEAAFAHGLAYGRTGPGGLLKRLFSARTLGLFDQLPAARSPPTSPAC